jgi:DNA-binding NarL/FixJ family response regulator
MSMNVAPPNPAADRFAGGMLRDDLEPAAVRLLETASGGDQDLLRALVIVANVIEARSGALPAAQLAALGALTEAWAGHYRPNSTGLGQRSPSEPDPVGLTQRQHQILSLLGDGLTVQAIARRLCLSPRTVGKHLERMYRRFGTSDRLTTVLRAQRFGLLPASSGG